jgi:hypothetical protein
VVYVLDLPVNGPLRQADDNNGTCRFDTRGTILLVDQRKVLRCRLEAPWTVRGSCLYLLSAETEVLMEGLRKTGTKNSSRLLTHNVTNCAPLTNAFSFPISCVSKLRFYWAVTHAHLTPDPTAETSYGQRRWAVAHSHLTPKFNRETSYGQRAAIHRDRRHHAQKLVSLAPSLQCCVSRATKRT